MSNRKSSAAALDAKLLYNWVFSMKEEEHGLSIKESIVVKDENWGMGGRGRREGTKLPLLLLLLVLVLALLVVVVVELSFM